MKLKERVESQYSGDEELWRFPRRDQELARIAKGLAHPARVLILRMLLERTECVCGEICDELPLAQSTVSQHLKLLKRVGLVQGEIDGPRVCYFIEPTQAERLRRFLGVAEGS